MLRRLLFWCATTVGAGAKGAPPRPPFVASDARIVSCSRTTHRFFDSSPFSPSGRYLAALRTRFEREPVRGKADVVVLDLHAAAPCATQRVVASTRAWDAQLGAQVQWGKNDSVLYYNDMSKKNSSDVHGVETNFFTGESTHLDCPVYHVSRCGRWAASADLRKMRLHQRGYGVVLDDVELLRNKGAPRDDGVYLTNLETRKCKLVVSLFDLVQKGKLRQRWSTDVVQSGSPTLPSAESAFYAFHVKFAGDSSRLLVVVRERGRRQLNHVLTTSLQGNDDIRYIASWGSQGNHPNWRAATGVTLNYRGEICDFDDATASPSRPPRTLSRRASGHPQIFHSKKDDRNFVLTDTYAKEAKAFGLKAGVSTLRLIDGRDGSREVHYGNFNSAMASRQDEWRCDLHPAFDRSYGRLAINVRHEATRHVAVLEVEPALAALRNLTQRPAGHHHRRKILGLQ